MEEDLNTHASASAIAKILGLPYEKGKEFKELLMDSDLETIPKSHVIKNRTVEYDAYDIILAVNYAHTNIKGSHIKSIEIDIG